MVYKVLWRKAANQTRNTGGKTPSLFDKCTGFFYVHTYTTTGQTASYKCLEQRQLRFHDWDSNTHAADKIIIVIKHFLITSNGERSIVFSIVRNSSL